MRTVPDRLPTGTLDPGEPGAPWWRYRRPEVPAISRDHVPSTGGETEPAPTATAGSVPPGETPPEAVVRAGAPSTPGVLPGVLAAAFAVVILVSSRFDAPVVGRVLVPVTAVLAAAAIGPRLVRRHPDEPWLGRFLVYGVVAKLVASYLRYYTLVDGYGGRGDATGYDSYGKLFAKAWLGGGEAPDLPDLRRTNFVRWFTGGVYYLVGSDMVAGFFVFGLLACLGSYLWYRATAESVPFVNKRLYFALVFFAPSIAFWPSSIGKEALMQLGIGSMALGTAFLLNRRNVLGLAVGAPGGWLLWVVRPHLLALVVLAATAAYLVGRSPRKKDASVSTSLARPIGMVIMAFLAVFAISAGADFLGIENLSLSSIEKELDEQTERSAQGGSQFDNGGNSLSPLRLPQGAATVLLRPFPWETDSGFQLLASLESVAVAVFLLFRLPSLALSLVRSRGTPFLFYCWTLTILYAATFSSFANFGLLVRQRSLVLPALFVLLAVEPALARAAPPAREPEARPGDPVRVAG